VHVLTERCDERIEPGSCRNRCAARLVETGLAPTSVSHAPGSSTSAEGSALAIKESVSNQMHR
jgi:hypothetical protein